MRQSCGLVDRSGEATRIQPRRLCWGAVRWERCALSTDRPQRAARPRKAGERSLILPPRRRPWLSADGDRGYRLLIRRWDVGLEIEIERSERELRLQLQHDVLVIVR